MPITDYTEQSSLVISKQWHGTDSRGQFLRSYVIDIWISLHYNKCSGK